MHCVAISDTHCRHAELNIPRCDTLIVAGDFTHQGTMTEIGSFLDWLEDQPAKHFLIALGNHEFTLDSNHQNYDPRIAEYMKFRCRHAGIEYGYHRHVEIDGVNFYLHSFTPYFHNWGFNVQDVGVDQGAIHMKKTLPNKNIPVDVFVSHGPMREISDRTQDGRHEGSVTLRTHIEETQPGYFVCGHIHEGRGAYLMNTGTMCFNVASLDHKYHRIHDPVEFEVEE